MIPRDIKEQGFENELVSGADFEEFMAAAYRKFCEIEQHEYLRRAINYTIPREAYSLESYYMLLFAALETLISQFRQEGKLDKILPDKLAKKMRDELNQWLNDQEMLE